MEARARDALECARAVPAEELQEIPECEARAERLGFHFAGPRGFPSGAPRLPAAVRVVAGGIFAMGITMGIGRLVGTSVG